MFQTLVTNDTLKNMANTDFLQAHPVLGYTSDALFVSHNHPMRLVLLPSAFFFLS